jgi:hypothetical protein
MFQMFFEVFGLVEISGKDFSVGSGFSGGVPMINVSANGYSEGSDLSCSTSARHMSMRSSCSVDRWLLAGFAGLVLDLPVISFTVVMASGDLDMTLVEVW